jgi:hypothetical protein
MKPSNTVNKLNAIIYAFAHFRASLGGIYGHHHIDGLPSLIDSLSDVLKKASAVRAEKDEKKAKILAKALIADITEGEAVLDQKIQNFIHNGTWSQNLQRDIEGVAEALKCIIIADKNKDGGVAGAVSNFDQKLEKFKVGLSYQNFLDRAAALTVRVKAKDIPSPRSNEEVKTENLENLCEKLSRKEEDRFFYKILNTLFNGGEFNEVSEIDLAKRIVNDSDLFPKSYIATMNLQILNWRAQLIIKEVAPYQPRSQNSGKKGKEEDEWYKSVLQNHFLICKKVEEISHLNDDSDYKILSEAFQFIRIAQSFSAINHREFPTFCQKVRLNSADAKSLISSIAKAWEAKSKISFQRTRLTIENPTSPENVVYELKKVYQKTDNEFRTHQSEERFPLLIKETQNPILKECLTYVDKLIKSFQPKTKVAPPSLPELAKRLKIDEEGLKETLQSVVKELRKSNWISAESMGRATYILNPIPSPVAAKSFDEDDLSLASASASPSPLASLSPSLHPSSRSASMSISYAKDAPPVSPAVAFIESEDFKQIVEANQDSGEPFKYISSAVASKGAPPEILDLFKMLHYVEENGEFEEFDEVFVTLPAEDRTKIFTSLNSVMEKKGINKDKYIDIISAVQENFLEPSLHAERLLDEGGAAAGRS